MASTSNKMYNNKVLHTDTKLSRNSINMYVNKHQKHPCGLLMSFSTNQKNLLFNLMVVPEKMPKREKSHDLHAN